MFVKNVRHEGEKQAEQVINQSMGVRRPPKRAIKESPVEEAKINIKERAQSKEPKPRIAHEKPPEKPSTKPSHAKIDSTAGTTTKNKDATTHQQANDTLESIKITAPGTYELNLPSLFERDELIMAVKEGTYFIDLSSAFRKGKKD